MLDDASNVIQGIDAFVFPSHFEGLGLALIEAQASGLKCIASDAVPKETAVSENVKYISIKAPMKTWIDEIKAIYEASYNRRQLSAEACASIKEHGYDISCEADKLAQIYRD